MALSPLKFELTNRQPIDDAELARILNMNPHDVRQERQQRKGVLFEVGGAWQVNEAGRWCWYIDKEYDA